MSTALVSVCIPVRDHAEHLGAAIASALSQDVDGLEVVVCDDASQDATPQVIAAATADPRVRAVRHDRALGVAANRNACLDHARGRYIAWLDADDTYLPGGLRRQVELLDAHPGAALAHGAFDVVDGTGRRLPSWPAPFPADTVEAGGDALRELLATNELTTSTVVVRRRAHDAAGPFAPEVGASSTDWDMWLRVAATGDVVYSATPVARYRQHEDSISRRTRGTGERLACDARVVARALARGTARVPGAARLAHAALAAKALLHAGDAYTRGDRERALDALAFAGRLVPSAAVRGLQDATRRGDDAACLAHTKAALAGLGDALEGTRFGARVRRAAATDPAWDAELAAVADAVRRSTPATAVLAVIAKWDPAVLVASGRAGGNYPDRALLPDGLPRDGVQALAHLRDLRRRHGTTHLVVPVTAAWWLTHYGELTDALGAPVCDEPCGRIFDLRTTA